MTIRAWSLAALIGLSMSTSAHAEAPRCPERYKISGVPEGRVDRVSCLLERLWTKGYQAAAELTVPDATLHEPEGLPYAGKFQGREELTRFQVERFMPVWRDLDLRLEDVYVSNDGAAALISFEGTSVATGKRIKTTVLERYAFDEAGLVTDIWPFYLDLHRISKEMGGDRLSGSKLGGSGRRR